MAEQPRLPQLNVEVTEAVKRKLGQIEADLADEKASKHEIVAVLIQAASAAKVPPSALKRYRAEVREARRDLGSS